MVPWTPLDGAVRTVVDPIRSNSGKAEEE
jgi:hypothetical protein